MPPIAAVEEETIDAPAEAEAAQEQPQAEAPADGGGLATPLTQDVADNAQNPAPEPAAAPADLVAGTGESDAKPESAEEVPDAETWAAIHEARAEEREAEERVTELSEELKNAKKRHEGASERLGRLIDEAESPGLFNRRTRHEQAPMSLSTAAAGSPDGGATVAGAIKAGLDQAAADQDKAAFDAATLGQLGIKAKLKENLEADGIRTGKDLAAWFNAVPRKKIPGIGEDPDKGGLKKVVDAMEEFYLKLAAKRDGKTGPKLKDGRNSLVGPPADPQAEPPSSVPLPETLRQALIEVFPEDKPVPPLEEIRKWSDAERADVLAWAHEGASPSFPIVLGPWIPLMGTNSPPPPPPPSADDVEPIDLAMGKKAKK